MRQSVKKLKGAAKGELRGVGLAALTYNYQ